MTLEFEDEPRRRRVSYVRITVGLVVLLFLSMILLALWQGAWATKQIVSNSMLPTLRKGEYVLVDCRPNREFKVNDVVMIKDPEAPGEYAAKRIIATGGQVVKWEKDRLTVDNAELVQMDPPSVASEESGDYVRGMNRADRRIKVGRDEVFVLGDNWGNSTDSFDYGPINGKSIVGIVRYVYWPVGRRREIH